MKPEQKLAYSGVLFPCLASIVQSFTPLWVFLALIITGMICTGIGLLIISRKAKHAELVAKMDKAFGKPNDRPE